jgi:superfamily II DNA/RNA helicase
MVIAPTRELATQIYGVFTQIARYYTNLKCALFIGGTDVKDNCDIFEKSGAQV